MSRRIWTRIRLTQSRNRWALCWLWIIIGSFLVGAGYTKLGANVWTWKWVLFIVGCNVALPFWTFMIEVEEVTDDSKSNKNSKVGTRAAVVEPEAAMEVSEEKLGTPKNQKLQLRTRGVHRRMGRQKNQSS